MVHHQKHSRSETDSMSRDSSSTAYRTRIWKHHQTDRKVVREIRIDHSFQRRRCSIAQDRRLQGYEM